jgi:hypothetical protein
MKPGPTLDCASTSLRPPSMGRLAPPPVRRIASDPLALRLLDLPELGDRLLHCVALTRHQSPRSALTQLTTTTFAVDLDQFSGGGTPELGVAFACYTVYRSPGINHPTRP